MTLSNLKLTFFIVICDRDLGMGRGNRAGGKVEYDPDESCRTSEVPWLLLARIFLSLGYRQLLTAFSYHNS
jgi:hypothetical protein